MIVSRHMFNGKLREYKIYAYDVKISDPVQFIKNVIECYDVICWHIKVVDDSCDDIGARREETAYTFEELDKYYEKIHPTFFMVKGKIGRKNIRFWARITDTGLLLTGSEDLYEIFQPFADDENCDWITDPDKENTSGETCDGKES